jgi:hypothetical protein
MTSLALKLSYVPEIATAVGQDEGGEYSFERKTGRMIPVFEMVGNAPEEAVQFIKAALRDGQQSSLIAHIMRLFAHKNAGKDGQKNQALIADYAQELAKKPEFCVIEAIEFFIKKDKKPFIPMLSEILDVVETIENKLKRELARIQALKQIAPPDAARPRPVPFEDWPQWKKDEFAKSASHDSGNSPS